MKFYIDNNVLIHKLYHCYVELCLGNAIEEAKTLVFKIIPLSFAIILKINVFASSMAFTSFITDKEIYRNSTAIIQEFQSFPKLNF